MGSGRRPGFNPWVREISWRREWLPTPVFLPGESQWTEEPGGLPPRGHKESDTTKRLRTHTAEERWAGPGAGWAGMGGTRGSKWNHR